MVLLTTGNGFIASSIIKKLSNSNNDVIILYRHKKRTVNNLKYILANDNITIKKFELVYYKKIFSYKKKKNIKYIFHIANSRSNILKETIKYDISFTKELFDAFENIPKVFMSSQRILDENNSVYENSNYFIENWYDMSKVFGEIYLQSKKKPFNKIIRIPILIGKNHGLYLTDQILYQLISLIIQNTPFLIKDKKMNGTSWIDPNDIAQITIQNNFSFLNNETNNIINFSAGWCSFYDILTHLLQLFHNRTTSNIIESEDNIFYNNAFTLPASNFILDTKLFKKISINNKVNSNCFDAINFMVNDYFDKSKIHSSK